MRSHGEPALAELLEEACVQQGGGGVEESCAGHKPMLLDACRIDKRLFSFMLESPLRVKPTTQPPLR